MYDSVWAAVRMRENVADRRKAEAVQIQCVMCSRSSNRKIGNNVVPERSSEQENIVASTSSKTIIPETTDQIIITGASTNYIISRSPIKYVAEIIAGDCIVAGAGENIMHHAEGLWRLFG